MDACALSATNDYNDSQSCEQDNCLCWYDSDSILCHFTLIQWTHE